MTQLALQLYFNIKKISQRVIISLSLLVLFLDTVYKSYFGITYLTRKACIIYGEFPRWLFLVYENIIELFFVVIFGVMTAVLIERYFDRLKKLMPRKVITAFIYASVIPVCSCSVIPLIKAMVEKVPFRVIITMVVAAPLLNPYIIMLSFTVLGAKYSLIRIIASFILSVSAGYAAEFFMKKYPAEEGAIIHACRGGGCIFLRRDIFEETFTVLKRIFPYILIAGGLSFLFEYFIGSGYAFDINLRDNFFGNALIILAGIPIYLCNGADVIFISPFVKYAGLPLGTAVAFSLTSTSVCISSIVMLTKYLGKKLTFILITWIVFMTFAIGAAVSII